MDGDRIGDALEWCEARARGEPLSAACNELLSLPRDPLPPSFVAWVYMLKAGDFYKIGIARDIESRIEALQGGCPFEIELFHAWPSHVPHQLESRLHFRLRQYRVRGEWFSIPDSVIRTLLCYHDIHLRMNIIRVA